MQEGAAIVYTLVGTTVQMVGMQTAGYVMQSQADQAGPKLGKWAMTHERARAVFEKVGTGTDLAPLIVAPIMAEAYVRVESLRGRLLPLLALMIPADAVEQIVSVFPPPEYLPPESPAGVADEPAAESPPATTDAPAGGASTTNGRKRGARAGTPPTEGVAA